MRTPLGDKIADFVSCGLDRSCPTSVTTPQDRDVRLDQYQVNSFRERTNKRKRQKSFENCGMKSSLSPSNRVEEDDLTILDHEFEWYDLDAIRELDNGNSNDDCAIITSHDFNAGLVFTTERQVLSRGVEVNVANPSASNKDNKNGQKFEFDLFFWVNSDHNHVGETPDEREFRKRMEKLEQEVSSDLSSLPSSSSHFSSSSSLSLS